MLLNHFFPTHLNDISMLIICIHEVQKLMFQHVKYSVTLVVSMTKCYDIRNTQAHYWSLFS